MWLASSGRFDLHGMRIGHVGATQVTSAVYDGVTSALTSSALHPTPAAAGASAAAIIAQMTSRGLVPMTGKLPVAVDTSSGPAPGWAPTLDAAFAATAAQAVRTARPGAVRLVAVRPPTGLLAWTPATRASLPPAWDAMVATLRLAVDELPSPLVALTADESTAALLTVLLPAWAPLPPGDPATIAAVLTALLADLAPSSWGLWPTSAELDGLVRAAARVAETTPAPASR